MYVYNIIDVASGATLATFDTPQAAIADVANHIGVKTRIVKAPRVDTPTSAAVAVVTPEDTKAAAKAHIMSKFDDGTYHRPALLSPDDPWFNPESLETFELALGFALASIPEDMCIHKSTQDPAKVCYVRWNERGHPTITRVTYPRLLELLGCPNEIARDIGCFLQEVNERGVCVLSKFELHTGMDAITDVYVSGPSSCMAHPEEHYTTGNFGHPVGVYGRPDNNDIPSPMGVYSYNKGRWVDTDDDDDDDDPDIPDAYFYTARTLVDHQAKIFSRIYGEDSEKLAGYLRSIGYTRDGEQGRSFEACNSWFCPKAYNHCGSFKLVMPFVDNHDYVFYDIRDGRAYFGDAEGRVRVIAHVTSGNVHSSYLAYRECVCCGSAYISPSSEDTGAARELEESGWYTHACAECNNSGVASDQLAVTHMRTIVAYSLESKKLTYTAPLTTTEMALVSGEEYVLVVGDTRLEVCIRPKAIPVSWKEFYPGVYLTVHNTFDVHHPQGVAILDYILWRGCYLPSSWFDESFMWAHKEYAETAFRFCVGTPAKKYTEHDGLFIGYKSHWKKTLLNQDLWTGSDFAGSPSIRCRIWDHNDFAYRIPVYFKTLQEWQDANNSK